MKKIILFAFVLCMSSWSCAQTDAHAAVEQQVKALSQAMISADAKALKNLTSAELSYGHSGGHVEDQAAFIEQIVSGTSDFVTIDLLDQSIKIMDNIAIVRHILSATTNDHGKPGTVKIGVMLIWKNDGKDWKLLARQAFKL
jgi:hypothetical protein